MCKCVFYVQVNKYHQGSLCTHATQVNINFNLFSLSDVLKNYGVSICINGSSLTSSLPECASSELEEGEEKGRGEKDASIFDMRF